jgi:molybdopterin/thiamine biosynthesis adenylyltransferase
VQNAITLISQHDIVLDCTDNVLARYLISDAAVMCGVQVVSGAGQGLEGQLVVLHKDLNKNAHASGYSQRKSKSESKIARGPCYRCLFPKAPRPEDVTDCEDGGVLGGVTGLVGTMQAVEGIKLLVGMSEEGKCREDYKRVL